jgi:DNA-binding CsgD family transcriptional regulator
VTQNVMNLDLTEREIEIVQQMAYGLSNEEIGKAVWVTVNTVKTHARRIQAKLAAKNRTHVVAICIGKGLIQCP